MELPDWIVDQVQPQTSPTAFALMVRLFRHGRQVAGGDGSRRIYWRGTRPQLARLTGASKRSVDEALAQLEERGFVRVHQPIGMHKPSGFSAPFELSTGATSAPLFEAVGAHHGDGQDLTPPLSVKRTDPTTTPTAREERGAVSASLAAAGVTDPERWIHTWGEERCAGALAMLDAAARVSTIQNGPGLMRTWLANNRPLTQPAGDVDRVEELKRRYLGGPLGHVVRYR